MNLATLKPAIQTWVATLLGVDPTQVVWENDPRPARIGILVTLSIIALAGQGGDETRWTFTSDPAPANNAVAQVTRNLRLTLQVSVESFDQTPGAGALETAQRLRDAWRSPSSLAFLASNNVAVSDVRDASVRDYPVQGRWISRAITEVRMSATSTYTDTRGATGTIEHVGVTSTITDESGAAYPTPLQIHGNLPS